MDNKSSEFRKGINIDLAINEIKFEKRLEMIAKQKEDNAELEEMNKKIDELVKAGKSSGAIRQTIKKIFPELSQKMEEQKIQLKDEEISRLTAQIRDRVEKFRNSLPYEESER